MNDPEKAKHLEENLAALPECAKSAVAGMYGADKAVASTLVQQRRTWIRV